MSNNTTQKSYVREANWRGAAEDRQSKRNFTAKKKARRMKRRKPFIMLIIQKVTRQYIVLIILTQLVIHIHNHQ